MNPTEVQRRKTKRFYDLLCNNRDAPIDEVMNVIESYEDGEDKSVKFDPEVSFTTAAENLPVCIAARAQRFDILKMLVEKYHADMKFTFYMSMIPVVNSMDMIPVSEVVHMTLPHFVVLTCCNDFDLCSKMLAFVSDGHETFKTCPSKLLLIITRAAMNCVDLRVIQAFMDNVKQLPTDGDGRTPLHYVAMRCGASTDPSAPVIQLLKAFAHSPAIVNAQDDYGLTALQYACRVGCLAAVRELIAAGANVNEYWGPDSCTALHLAVAAQSIDVVHELLRAGAKRDTEVLCDYVANEKMSISGDPSDVARAAGNFRLARYVSDPLRSSLGVLLDGDPSAEGNAAAAIMFEPAPGEPIDGVCQICLEETKLIPLGHCHHAFCKSCLSNWFRSNSNGVTRPQCPHTGCNVPVSIYDVRAVLGEDEAGRIDQLLLQRTLAEMPDFRWCPRCSNGGFFQGKCPDAECTNCGYKFCTECQQEAHPGMTCREKCLQMVDAKVGSMHWISTNTKPCPGCHAPICKNGGCSHMRCSRCNYEFCWYCLGKYQGVYTFEPRCPCPKRKDP